MDDEARQEIKMGYGVKWPGSNWSLGPPRGVSEEQCSTLPTFTNGACSVSCWEFSPDELAEILRTKRIFVSVWSGMSQPAIYLGSEKTTHQMVADFGAVWKLGD